VLHGVRPKSQVRASRADQACQFTLHDMYMYVPLNRHWRHTTLNATSTPSCHRLSASLPVVGGHSFTKEPPTFTEDLATSRRPRSLVNEWSREGGMMSRMPSLALSALARLKRRPY